MKTILKLAIGTFALATAALTVPEDVSAGTFSDVIFQSQQTSFSHLGVSAVAWGGIRSARLNTSTWSGNAHDGWLYINCINQPFKAVGGRYSGGSAERVNYFCPGTSRLNNAQGFINDN